MSQKIKTLKYIHLAILAGVILIYILLGDISLDTSDIPELDSTFLLYLMIAIVAIVLGNFLFKSQLKQVDRNKSVEDNFGIYQGASIIRWAILEGAAIVILFLAPDYWVLGIIVIAVLAFYRPTEGKMEGELREGKRN